MYRKAEHPLRGRIGHDMQDAGRPCNPKTILLIMQLVILHALFLSIVNACQQILRAIALAQFLIAVAF